MPPVKSRRHVILSPHGFLTVFRDQILRPRGVHSILVRGRPFVKTSPHLIPRHDRAKICGRNTLNTHRTLVQRTLQNNSVRIISAAHPIGRRWKLLILTLPSFYVADLRRNVVQAVCQLNMVPRIMVNVGLGTDNSE